MAASDPATDVPTPTGVLRGVAAFSWDGAAWQPSGRAGPSVPTPTGVLRGVAPFTGGGTSWTPAGRAQPGVPTPSGVLDGVAVYTWSGSAWTPPGGQSNPATPTGTLQGVAAFNWDGTAWQPAAQAGPSVATPYGVLDGVAMFNWSGSAWAAVEAPSLALDFMTPGTLDPRITFTRASTGTYFDSAGVMQTAATNAPRWDRDPATLALRGLLLEEARTNSVTQSSDFTNIAWVKGASATLAAGVPGPNGPTTGSGLISANATIGFLAQAYTAAAGTAITMSCFVKAGSLSSVLLLMPATWWADATNRIGTYDLAAGIVSSVTGAGATGTIQPAGNGWYRISLTATPGVAGTASPQFARATATGNGVAIQHYAFGAQLEAGAFPTSHIPTVGAAVTRAVDLCSMPTSPWFNAATGSLVVEAYAPPVGANVVLNCAWAALDDGTANNVMELRSQTGFADFRLLSFVGGVNSGVSVSGNTMVANTIFKGAGTYTITPASSRISMNGAAPPASSVTALPSAAMTMLRIGPSRGNSPNNAVRRVSYYARALTDAEMQSVTT